MGNTIWVKIESSGVVQCDERDHSIICELDRKLDEFAHSAGVTPISHFYDGSEMAAEFADEDMPIPDPQWYDPAVGLATIEALVTQLDDNPDLFLYADDPSRSHWRADLLDELNNCQNLLASAAQSGNRFHFAILM